jgi:hypothetical protein
MEKNLKLVAVMSMLLASYAYGFPLWTMLRPVGDYPFGSAWQFPEVRFEISSLAVITVFSLFFAASIGLRSINKSRELLLVALISVSTTILIFFSLKAAYALWFGDWRFASGLHILRAGLLLLSCVSGVTYLMIIRTRSNEASQRTSR